MIRIANGQGFWGDWLEAPVRLVEQGPIDYLALDYLAEVTMSILQKQKQADPESRVRARFSAADCAHREAHARARHQGDRQRGRRESGGVRARGGAAGAGAESGGGAGRRRVSDGSTNFSPRATRCATWTRASRSRPFAIAS